jgi:hypothetical protein
MGSPIGNVSVMKVESFLDGKGTVFLGHTNVSKTYHFITNFP